MTKIVVLDGASVNRGDLSWADFETLGALRVYENLKKEDVVASIGDSEIVLTNKVVIDKTVLDACPSIKYIGVLATGYNTIDLAYAAEKDVVVTNIPAYSTESVVQHVFALLLEYCSRVGYHDLRVKAGAWEASELFGFWDYPIQELSGKTLGIVGLGQIGTGVAKVANAFGMMVLGNARTPKTMEGVTFVSLEELYQEADIVTLHCPLTAETEGMINKNTIGAMKEGVILINTGRGPLVAEDDVASALDTGKLAAYLADVFSSEPPKPGSRLLYHPKTIITPHYAWAPKEARTRLLQIAHDNIVAFLEGVPKNQVN